MSEILEQARRLAIQQLTSDNSRPVRLGLSKFWEEIEKLPGFETLERQTVLEGTDIVFLTSEQFILCRWVREAALAYLKGKTEVTATGSLWETLKRGDLLPKHASARATLLEKINAVYVGSNLVIHADVLKDIIREVLLEVEKRGMKITEVKNKLDSRCVLPTDTGVLQPLLAAVSVKIENIYYHPDHTPTTAERQLVTTHQRELAPDQKAALKLLSGDDPSSVVFLDLDEFLLALMDASVSVPDDVSGGDKPGATYSFLNGLGVVEVDGSKVVLLIHVIAEFEQILLTAGADGISKTDMWDKLRQAKLQPVYRLGKAHLPKKSFAVKRNGPDGDMYYHEKFAPALPEPEPETVPLPVLVEQKLETPVEPELIPPPQLVTDQPLGEKQPLDDPNEASFNLAGLAGQMLQNLTPQMLAAVGLGPQVTLGGVTAVLLPVLQRADAANLVAETHVFPGENGDSVDIQGFGGVETHHYGLVAAVVVLRYKPSINGNGHNTNGHKE